MQGLHNRGTGPRKWVTSFLGLSPTGWKKRNRDYDFYLLSGKWGMEK